MSIAGPKIAALAAGAINKRPRLGRSLASFERMIAATKKLMLERGSENFTLQDVSDAGNVSIGSIYLRFESKDRLLHAVIAEELSDILEGEQAMIARVLEESDGLANFLENYIASYSKFLHANAAMLRTIMQRAAIDSAVSEPGKETARLSASMSINAIMTFEDQIRGPDKLEKAAAVFQIIFATIARQYGLGSNPEAGDPALWPMMRGHLGRMTYAYLQHSG